MKHRKLRCFLRMRKVIASYEIRYLALSEEGALLNDASWESAQPTDTANSLTPGVLFRNLL